MDPVPMAISVASTAIRQLRAIENKPKQDGMSGIDQTVDQHQQGDGTQAVNHRTSKPVLRRVSVKGKAVTLV
jgi:hypothetical protein